MDEPRFEDDFATGMVDEDGFLSSCFYCDKDIYIFDERFNYCEQCQKEGK